MRVYGLFPKLRTLFGAERVFCVGDIGPHMKVWRQALRYCGACQFSSGTSILLYQRSCKEFTSDVD